MNLAPLQTFVAILETGSLVRAAEQLNVTQSTVTARLQALEAELGQPLITRLKSGAQPTPAGLRLRRYAETMLSLWGQAQQDTRLPSTVSSICHFAAEPDLWPGLGREIMGRILGGDAEAALSVQHGSADQLTAWLIAGTADLILTTAPPRQAGLVVFDLVPDELILVSTRPDPPLRFDKGYVFVEAGAAFGREHAVFYADAGTARITFGAAVPGLDYLLDVGGSAYLPRRMVTDVLAEGRLHEITHAPVYNRPVYLVADAMAARRWAWLDGVVGAFSAP